MSRRNNRSRRNTRKNRKEAYRNAMKAFHEKYPERGTIPGPLILNVIAMCYGRAEADRRLREAKDPFKFDNVLMKIKRELYEEYCRNNNWKKGVDDLPVGWGKEKRDLDAMTPITRTHAPELNQ